MKSIRRLLIVSHVIHYRYHGQVFAFGPYAREIDIWADLFPQVMIASPCRNEKPPGDCLTFSRPNISVAPQLETGGTSLLAKMRQFLLLPVLICGLIQAMRQADAIHVRCPGNLGLIGTILAPLFSRYRVAKYAGQWNGYSGEPWSVRLQRWLLRSRWWGGPVTVYGQWPQQPPHIVPFFTSVLTEKQISLAKEVTRKRQFELPLRLLYVGRLSAPKNVVVLVRAVAELKKGGIPVECCIVGSGTERRRLEELAIRLGVRDCVRFSGGVRFERVLDYYEKSHALVLVSQTEGWPKAIAEGMAFGLICIASDRGLMPEMLSNGRGFVVEPGDVNALSNVIRGIARSPESHLEVSRKAAEWGQRYSLEHLRSALQELLSEHWNVPVAHDCEPQKVGHGKVLA